MIKQLPISLAGVHKSDVRTQFAALCYKVVKGNIKFLLITSRESRRWIIPKGWPMDGKTPAAAAAVEAWEEAGVRGQSDGRCVGIFSYNKMTSDKNELPCVAMVFAIEVETLADTYPESDERDRVWVSRKKASKMVEEPELSRIIRDFEPPEFT